MGLTDYLKKKFSGPTPAEKASKERMKLTIERQAEQARFEGELAGAKKKAYREGYKKGSRKDTGFLGKLDAVAGAFDAATQAGANFLDIPTTQKKPPVKKKKKQKKRQEEPYLFW